MNGLVKEVVKGQYGHRPKVSINVVSHRLRSDPQMVVNAVLSATNQTDPDVEVRVVFQEENRPTKLNDLVKGSSGHWITVLCDDDLLHPKFVEMGMAVAEEAPDINVIYTDRKVFRSHEKPDDGYHFRMHGPKFCGPDAYRIQHTPGSFVFGQSLPMTIMVRRDLWDRMGGHDSGMPHSDTELWYRMANAGAHFAYLPYPLFYYREHYGQMCRIVNTMPDALRVFHRKHFLAFGIAFHPMRGYELPGTAIPVHRRLAYKSAYLPSLTTSGYMALERKKMRDSARAMIILKQREAETAVNAAISLVLQEEGLSAEDGWKVNTNYELVREVPDPPADLAIAATDAIVGVDGNLKIVGDRIEGEHLGEYVPVAPNGLPAPTPAAVDIPNVVGEIVPDPAVPAS